MSPLFQGFPARIVCGILLSVAAFCTVSRAEYTETVRPQNPDMTFSVTVPDQWSGSGFFPVKVDATNKGNHPLSFSLSFLGSHVGTMAVRAKHSQTFYFYIPPTLHSGDINYQSMTLTDLSSGASTSASLRAWESRFIIPCHVTTLPSLAANIDAGRSSPEGFAFNPANWPADRRVYSSFSYMVVEREAYDQLDQAIKNAIAQWVAMGGQLMLVGVDPAQPSQYTSDPDGWGMIHHLRGQSEKDLQKQISEVLDESFESPYPELPSYSSDYEVRSPAGILITLLIVFSIVVGPLCLFVWAPANRRQRLFVLIPSISLGFSVLLLLLILLIDGTGGRGVRVAAVYLDPERNSATILQQQISQTGLLLNNSFTLDPKVNFSSTFSTNSPRGSRVRSGDSLSGDWFSSRSTMRQELAYAKSTRARVAVVDFEGNRPVVQSTLPCTLTNFIYQDDKGAFWTAAKLPPGQKTPLFAASPELAGRFSLFKGGKLFFNGESGEATELTPMPTLESIKWKDEKTFYFGPVVLESSQARHP